MTGRWIDVYPIGERKVNLNPSEVTLLTSLELTGYIDELWSPKVTKGWKSSWIPMVTEINFNEHDIDFYLGAMTYAQTNGLLESIKNRKPFAPSRGYINNLSLGVIPVTKDGFIPLRRRDPNLPHCPGVWIHPCGYFTSIAFDRENCDNPAYAKDPRLFDMELQLKKRVFEQEFSDNLKERKIDYNINPDLFGAGWQSLEMYFSTVANLDITSSELPEFLRDYKIAGAGVSEHGSLVLISLEKVEKLLLNQGRLANINPKIYCPQDETDIPIIDETLTGILWAHSNRLHGLQLDKEKIIKKLKKDGLEIRILDTLPGKQYKFPMHF